MGCDKTLPQHRVGQGYKNSGHGAVSSLARFFLLNLDYGALVEFIFKVSLA